jgi:hypothetical protein
MTQMKKKIFQINHFYLRVSATSADRFYLADGAERLACFG